MSTHVSQLLYFALFTFIFNPFSVQDIIRIRDKLLIKLKKTNFILRWLLLNIVFLAVVHYTSFRHPFLESDNRHYSQKFYKFVISTHRKYYFVPIYAFIVLFLYEAFKPRIGEKINLFFLMFVLCCILTLVPTPLFDFRYFLTPWTLLALEINGINQNENNKGKDIRKIKISAQQIKLLWINIIGFASISFGILFIFRNKPWVNVYFNNELSRLFW